MFSDAGSIPAASTKFMMITRLSRVILWRDGFFSLYSKGLPVLTSFPEPLSSHLILSDRKSVV